MEYIQFNITTNQYEYYFSQEVEPHRARNGYYNHIDGDNSFMIESSTDLNDILNKKIENTIYDIIYAISLTHIIRFKISGLYIATGLRKSASKKSVYHTAPIKVKHQRELQTVYDFRYNLPEPFRESNFTSAIIAVHGPFTKKNINGVIHTVPEWYMEVVTFIGSFMQCLEKTSLPSIRSFILDCMTVQSIRNLPLEKFDEVSAFLYTKEETIIKKLRDIASSLNEKFSIDNDIESHVNDNSMDLWREVAEEEEKSMDDETNGWWRWNTD